MKRKSVIIALVVALASVAGAAALVAQARSDGGDAPPMAAPPDWVQAIVSHQVGFNGDPAVSSAVWVLADYDSAAARVNQQPKGSGQEAYLVVLTSETEFVNYKSFSPTGEPTRGKHVVLLIDATTHQIDTFGIGPDVVDLSGLGQTYTYTVD